MAPVSMPIANAAPPASPETRNMDEVATNEINTFASVLGEQQSAGTDSAQEKPLATAEQVDTDTTNAPKALPAVETQSVLRPVLNASNFPALLMLPNLATTPSVEIPATGECASADAADHKDETSTIGKDDTSLELAASAAGLNFIPQVPVLPARNQPENSDQGQLENNNAVGNSPPDLSTDLLTTNTPLASESAAVKHALERKSSDAEPITEDLVSFAAQFAEDSTPEKPEVLLAKALKLETVEPKSILPREKPDFVNETVKTSFAKQKTSAFGPEIPSVTADDKSVTHMPARFSAGALNPLAGSLSGIFQTAVAHTNFSRESLAGEPDAAITAVDGFVMPAQNLQVHSTAPNVDFSPPTVSPAQHLIRTTLDSIPKPLSTMNIQIQPEGFGPIQVRVSAPAAGAARVEIRTADPAARALLNDNLPELQSSLKTDAISVQPLTARLNADGSNAANAGDERSTGDRGHRQNSSDPQRQPGKQNQQEVFELFGDLN